MTPEKSIVIGDFVIESHVIETPDGRGLVTMTVRRLIATGLPLSADEQEQLRAIQRVADSVAAAHGAALLGGTELDAKPND